MTETLAQISRKEAIFRLWNEGILIWKLRPYQKIIYETITGATRDVTTILASRRLGKSFTLCVYASEICLKKPGAIVKYVCPEKAMVKKIIGPIMRTIFKDCPAELRPEFKVAEGLFRFPNGSEIQCAGSENGNCESLRGGASEACIVDEAGFVTDLEYVVNSILAPTTDTTDGKIILASTPSKESNHQFITHFVNPAEARGELIKYTIYDNTSLTPEKINKIISRYAGGTSNREFQREYLCVIVIDEGRAVIPEFTTVQSRIVVPWEKPARYDCYVSMDIGFKDFTIVLFAYYDFFKAKLVICDELVLNGPDLLTPNLAKLVKEKEKENFTDPVTKEVFKPKRVSDNNNLILLNDLNLLHSIQFLPTAKDNKEAAINRFRDLILREQIIITPNCTNAIAHFKHATWNKKRTEFDRAKGFGHYDGVDSAIYLVRNVNFNKNPYSNHFGKSPDEWHLPVNKSTDSNTEALKKIFKLN
jgi:hypothetical protein